MRSVRRFLLLFVVGVFLVPPVGAQGLGAAAEREKERRKKAGATAKSYGDGDLSGASSGAPAPPSHRPSSSAPAAKPEKSGVVVSVPDADADRASEESGWRARAREARAALVHAESKVNTAEAVIAGRLPTLARDGHCVATVLDPPNGGIARCEDMEAGRLERARSGLAGFRLEAEAARQALREFQATALRAGVPYDWIR